MKQRCLFPTIAVYMICCLIMTSCSAAGISAANSGAVVENMAHLSETQDESSFDDVPANAWYAEAVSYCRQHGIMSGITAAAFAPEELLTRAMLATVLYRMSGSPAAADAPAFTDAAAGAWYSAAVSWAAESKVISGYDNKIFGVNDPTTREQAAAILWRYAGSPEGGTADAFSDAGSISEWAKAAVRWANASGILDEMTENNRFAPKTNITRGEAASMLYHYLNQQQPGTDGKKPADCVSEIKINISFHGHTYSASLADNTSAAAFAELLKSGPLTVSAHDYGSFEKAGDLGTALPRNDEQITTSAGDIILYQGNQITVYYAENSWSLTRLGRIDDPSGLRDALGGGDVAITFSLADANPGGFDLASKSVTLNSGYEMPINGLGTYSLHGETCVTSVKSALASGVRLIDTASAYGNEQEVGQAIREAIEELGIPREEIFVITKIYPGSEMADPATSIQACLNRLDIGYVDMMLLHHPDRNDVKAYQVMEKFVESGQIRSLGLSNWYVEELEEFLPQVTITPALVQNEIHPYYQENDVIPYIQTLGIVVQGWYPLGGRGHTAELLGDKVISAIAKDHSVSPAQVILRWNLQKGVVVIPGSSNPDHIKENTELYDFSLTDAEMAQINALDRNEKHDWY